MRYFLLAPVVVTTVACGAHVSSTDVQTFRSDALAIAAAASTYSSQAAQMQSVSGCTTVHQGYDSQVRPMIGRMQSLAPEMDSMMGDEQHMGDGDMDCAANAMMAELDAHRSAACASSADMAANEAEAQRHSVAMMQWATHAADRSQELGSLMGMAMGMGGNESSGSHCRHDSDGGYSLDP